MRLKHAVYICLSLLFVTISCKDDNENVILDASKDAQLYSFSVKAISPKTGDAETRAQDSIRFLWLNASVFVIDQLEGVIYNPDSLPHGLELQKVAMTVTVNSTYGISKFEIKYPDSLNYTEWNRTDSVDFSKLPLYFDITAPYGTSKGYKLDLRIHQVDPDVMGWDYAGELPKASEGQKILLSDNKLYAYLQSGFSLSVYTAEKTDNPVWNQESVDLPTGLAIESIVIKNDRFYAIDIFGNSFASQDGFNWAKQENGYDFVALYGILPSAEEGDDELLLGYAGTDGRNYFATTKDMLDIQPVTAITTYPHDISINAGFPLEGFSSVVNYDRKGYSNMLILVAGINGGEDLNSTWLVRKTTENTLEITSSVKNPFFAGTGSSAFFYDDYLYVLFRDNFYRTKSWGDLWAIAPEKESLVEIMGKRKQQNVIVDDKNYIWIFGGISGDGGYLTDIWKGRVNRLSVN